MALWSLLGILLLAGLYLINNLLRPVPLNHVLAINPTRHVPSALTTHSIKQY